MGIDALIYFKMHKDDTEELTPERCKEFSIEKYDHPSIKISLSSSAPEDATHVIQCSRYYDETHRGYGYRWPWLAYTLLWLWQCDAVQKIWYQSELDEEPKPLTKQRFLKIMKHYIEEAR